MPLKSKFNVGDIVKTNHAFVQYTDLIGYIAEVYPRDRYAKVVLFNRLNDKGSHFRFNELILVERVDTSPTTD